MTEMNANQPRLLVISHVSPFPGRSGQEQRVLYTLKAARQLFHVTFATPVGPGQAADVKEKLSRFCDEVVLLPSQYSRSRASKIWHRMIGTLYSQYTGLKLSNYIIGRLELSPARVGSLVNGKRFDCALFEYWHAADSAAALCENGIPCVLDMHDLLWQARAGQLSDKPGLPEWWKRWLVNRYRAREEAAWKQFDGVIAINREEEKYVQARVSEQTKLFHAPMGVDLALWPYSWQPVQPRRVAYYGGLGNHHNQQGALRCVRNIMPTIWREFPDTEVWLVGSNPPDLIKALASDPRVKVTGYVEDVKSVLRAMAIVVCPWSGTYGFRSRLIEVMALGVPVVTSPDAVFGMELEEGKGLFLGRDDDELAGHSLRLLENNAFAREQSRLARQQVETAFSFENTYVRPMRELRCWLEEKRNALRSRHCQGGDTLPVVCAGEAAVDYQA